jgi:glycerophosphoryl diester phosphodiesterase
VDARSIAMPEDKQSTRSPSFFTRTGLLFMVLCLAPSVVSAQPRFSFFEPVVPPRPIQVMVHRGLAIAAPENSAAAIEMCAQEFCEWAEIDVRLTKDGRHVIIHDETADATTNGTGKVSDLTLDELKNLDAGSWFAARFAGTRLMTLPEALAVAKGKVNLYLDCKRIDPKMLAREVMAARMERQVVVYDSPDVLAQVKAASKGTVAGMTKYRPTMGFDAFIQHVAPAAVEIDAPDVTAELCRRFHAAGIKVQAKVLGTNWDNPTVWKRVIDAGVDWLQTDDPAGIPFFDARRRLGTFPVMISCHRGANHFAPENTLPAIREAARLGADFAEIDIRTTRDGQAVLMHDGTVNRTTNGKGAVRELTFKDATALHAGTWFGGKQFRETRVPSFEDGLTALGDKMGVYLDAKDIAPEALIAAIQRHHLSQRHVVYQSVDYCARLRMLDRTVRTLPPLGSLDELDNVAAIKPYGVDAKWSILSRHMIDECHRRGIKVFSDALGSNERVEQYQKAIEWGIDCIQTDYPLRVLRAIELSTAQK